MPRYVDADKVIDVMKAAYWDENIQSAKDDPCVIDAMIDWSIRQVKDAPTEDVAPVIHAHWETDKHAALDFCSSCGEAVERYVTAEQMDKSNYKGATYWNYCPHCGAKMDEE